MTRRKAQKEQKRKKLEKKEKEISFKSEKIFLPRTKIKVFGIGGGGNSIVTEIAPQLKEADFLAVNTDLRALKKSAKKCKTFLFGENLTHNLGTGMDPYLGELAAQKEKEKIQRLFQRVDFTILIASLGGGTGSGALPVFAESARKAGSVVLGIFTLPFKFEGEKKALLSKKSLEKTEPFLHGLILISNERIFRLIDKKTPLGEALSCINKILVQSLSSLIQVFSLPGLINIDFSDLKTILKGKEKLAYLHSLIAEGEESSGKIISHLFQSPLYEYNIKKPKRILFNITGGKNLKISEVERISKAIYERNPQAKIIFGISQSPNYERKIKVTLLVLGSEEKKVPKRKKMIAKLEKKLEKKGPEEEIKLEKIPPEKKKKPLSGKKIEVPKEKTKEQEVKKESKQPIEKELKLKSENKRPKKKITLRRNALDLKKESKRIEKELLAEESRWDFPAFLRRKSLKISPSFHLPSSK